MDSSNKLLARNTLVLYSNMVLSIVIGIFTSRIILSNLGVVDYGIYNAVGGFVAMFGVVSTSMSNSISRFITFELGRNDITTLKSVLSTSVVVQIIIALLIVLICETFGLWFLYNKMVIPVERFDASIWVFHLSVLSFVFSIISVPYTAIIVAHEDFIVFALFSIVDSLCRLLIVISVIYSPFDLLIYYALMLFFLSVLMRILYVWYCNKHYVECNFSIHFYPSFFRRIFSFAGWNTIGTSAGIFSNQGNNLLFNLFGGPIANAALGITNSLSSVVSACVANFTTSFSPQLTKFYSSGQYERLMPMIIKTSKYSYYMMFVLALPLFLNVEDVFDLWLGSVPTHAPTFFRICILISLVDILSAPLIVVKNATGVIRNYQIVVGGILMMTFPVAYVFLYLDYPIETVLVVRFLFSIITLMARMIMLSGTFEGWSSVIFTREVLVRVCFVSLSAILLTSLQKSCLPLHWIIESVVAAFCAAICIFCGGLTSGEKKEIVSIVNKVMIHIFRK